MKMIQLDGQAGGGQILRSALSLAMVTGQPFRIVNIRGKRRKPGLMRQHLTCVRAATEVCDGVSDGAEIGSTELVFRPGEIRSGSYRFAIGTAGSTSLLLQTLLPALWHGPGESDLELSGGTHNPLAPPFDFIERVFLPAMAKMGARADLQLVETGFAPAGGGILQCAITPLKGQLEQHHFGERGEVMESSLRVISRAMNDSVAQRVITAVQREWPCSAPAIERREEGPGQGLVCLAEVICEHGSEMVAGFGERSVSSENVGRRIGRSMATFLGTRASVGRHLGDQLLLSTALAGGGSYLTTAPDSHLPTNISVVESFLPVTCALADEGGGHFRMVVK